MAGCKTYGPATTDFPGGVPVKESCIDTKGMWGEVGRVNTEWFYTALYLYHGVKWGITAFCGYLGYRFKRAFRIGSAAYAGAYEIQATCVAIYTFLVYGYGDDILQYASQEYAAGASLALLYVLMLAGCYMQHTLKDLEVAVDECEAAGRARARLRSNMDDLQQDIRDLRAKASEEKEEHREDAEAGKEQIDQIDERTEQQIKVINMQLDSIKVAAAVAEKKVCDPSRACFEPQQHMHECIHHNRIPSLVLFSFSSNTLQPRSKTSRRDGCTHAGS